jgi:hypothetical protein
VCFSCNREYIGAPKISRRDNKTPICSICAELEAFHEIVVQSIQRPTEAAFQKLYLLLSIRFGSATV